MKNLPPLPTQSLPPQWDGVVQEALSSSSSAAPRLRCISWRMVSPCPPGWIAPPKPVSLCADTGVGLTAAAPTLSCRIPRRHTRFQKLPPHRGDKKRSVYWIFFIPGRKLPASPHHGFQLQRHSQTGIRADTEQEAGGEYRYCCTCCGRRGEGGGGAGGGGSALPVVLGRETGLKWGFFIALLADSSLSPNFVLENISERWQSRDWLIVPVLWM